MTRNRDEIELDLPFLVNGALDEAERAEVEALMAEDALLAAERDALAVIRAQMQAEEVRSPGEFGLARLMRDVGSEGGREGGREGAALAAAPAPNRTWMWQLAAAIAVVALLGQALFLRNDTGAGYELAGVAEGGALVVTFFPDASEDAIRGALLDAGVEIVGGPSALGLYRLDALDGVDPADAAERLRAAGTIVESVENALD